MCSVCSCLEKRMTHFKTGRLQPVGGQASTSRTQRARTQKKMKRSATKRVAQRPSQPITINESTAKRAEILFRRRLRTAHAAASTQRAFRFGNAFQAAIKKTGVLMNESIPAVVITASVVSFASTLSTFLYSKHQK